MISERTSQLQELRRQLSLKEQELCEVKWDHEKTMGGETEHLRSVLRQKEDVIKVRVDTLAPVVSPVHLIFTVDLYSSGADAGPGRGKANMLWRD